MRIELADIIKKFGKEFREQHQPNGWILRTFGALESCRTSALGGHIQKCDECGHEHISYNSCRNRHCPKCQNSKQAFWVEDVSMRLIDSKYFHVVFTIPEVLNEIFLLDSKRYYSLLFRSVWETLRLFGYSRYGVETGALAILHTWGQNLMFHPHIHCLIPALGLDLDGRVKHITTRGKYLYPVEKMKIDFRSVMMKNIKYELKSKHLLPRYQQTIDIAWNKHWVIHIEAPFGDSNHVIKYLGNYTHRVAISNGRIHSIVDKEVSFFYKDNKDGGKSKLMTITGIEFLRRFSMHILPKGFVKIRYFGILSNRYRKKLDMYRIPNNKPKNETPQERLERLTGIDILLCPRCKKGHLHNIKEIPKIRSPMRIMMR